MEITIIIPVYNREAYLATTLCHIPPCYPLIVVDNASTDGTRALAEQLCRERNALPGAAPSVVVSETTPGAAAARNHGLALCQTEWVYFFDSDDTFTGLPQLTGEDLDMICFPVRMTVDGKERIRDYSPTTDAATHLLNSMLNTLSMLFRTEWLRSIGGWDARCRIWDDWELGLRVLLHRPRLRWETAQPYHHVLVHSDSITGDSFSSRWPLIRDTLRIVGDHIATLPHLSEQERRRLTTAFACRCYITAGQLRREGHPEAAAAIRSIAPPSFPYHLLETYTALGGRGAWRIALHLLPAIPKYL